MNVENAMRVQWTEVVQMRSARRGRRPRLAVTLIELLIAIAIVAAMLVIVAPNLLGQLDERRFDSTGDVLLQQLLLARAHAQTTGNVVEVRYVAGGDGDASRVESRLLIQQPVERWPEMDSEAINGGRRGLAEESVNEGDDVNADQTTIYESWAVQELPAGYRLSKQGPRATPAMSELEGLPGGAVVPFGLSRSAMPASTQVNGAGQSMRIALFLSDGSTIASEPRWLTDDAQRSAKISINAWTGLATVVRVESADGDREERLTDTLRDNQ